MANIFDQYYQQYDAWYVTNKWAYLSELKTIKKLLPQKGRGLEIGVGTGRFAAPLGIDIGIDISEKMLSIARQRGVDARLGDGEHLQFPSCTFDYVVIVVTICFVQSPLNLLKETARVIKNKGQVVIGIIDKDSFLGKFYQKEMKSIFYKYANFFSVTEITDLLKSAGFNSFSYCQTLFNLPSEMNSVETPLESYGKGGFVVISAQKSKESKMCGGQKTNPC